jgi:hypothetical protein
MPQLWLMPQILQGKPNVVFQHGGAPLHIHSGVTTFFNMQLLEQWIGRGRSTFWPPRSPVLTTSQYFPVGLGEKKVYLWPMLITLKT